jgi:uncharacterized membrane protein
MSQKAFLIMINIPVILIVFLLGLFLPELSSKDLLFGFRLSHKQRASEEIKNVIKTYMNLYMIICGMYTFLLILVFSFFGKYYILFPGLIILVILMEVVYSRAHRILSNMDSLKGLNNAEGNYIIIRNDKYSKATDYYWLLISFSFALFTLLGGIGAYESIPIVIPSYLLMGKRSGIWLRKSLTTIYVSVLLQLAIITASYFINRYISHTKLNLGSINTEKYEKIVKIYIKIWSRAYIVICSMLCCIFMLIGFNSVIIINKWTAYLLIALLLSAICIVLIATYKSTGANGEKLELNRHYIKSHKTAAESAVINRNDEAYWKLGNFYFNPRDPNMWIKRTSGRGYDLNYGKPASWLILSIFMALFIFATWILIMYGK